MFDFITIGGANRDVSFFTDKGEVIKNDKDLTKQKLLAFEHGAKISSNNLSKYFGGGACNVGATLAKLGLNVAVMCRVGCDGTGKSIIENLHNLNIDTSLVQTDEKKSSALSFVVINEEEEGGVDRVIFTHRGASNNLVIDSENLKNTEYVYMTSLWNGWKKGVDNISEFLKNSKVKLAWNPGISEIRSGKSSLIDLIERTEIFIVNKDEAMELVQKDNKSGLKNEELNDISKLLKTLKNWGASVVVITDGKNGAFACDDKKCLHAKAFSREKVDTTGAGDAFGSGFSAGYFLTEDLEESLKFGSINSGSVIMQSGAQKGILSRDQIESELEKVVIEEIF